MSECIKELILCHKLWYSNFYIFATQCCRPLTFQTIQRRRFSAPWNHLLKGLTFVPPYICSWSSSIQTSYFYKVCLEGLSQWLRDWCKSCLQCQRGKVLRHVHIRPEKIPVPFRRFAHVHLDLVGPLPSSNGFTYLFTCIDRSTRWPEAIPLTGISAAECASAMFHGWISRLGLPAVITSDRGAQLNKKYLNYQNLCFL